MASATSARSGEKASPPEVPSWVHKLKEGLQRTAQPEGEPSVPEAASSAPAAPARAAEPPGAPAVAHAAVAAPAAAPAPAPAAPAAAPVASVPAAAPVASVPAAAPVASVPAEVARQAEPVQKHEPRARRSAGPTLTPAPRWAQPTPGAPAMAIPAQAASASPSTIVRLQLPDRRLVLALLPAVPRVGEIVDLSGDGGPQPFDVVAVRWGVHASGGFTGVTVELRSRG